MTQSGTEHEVKVVGECVECDTEMVARRAYDRLSVEERARLRVQGRHVHRGFSLCTRCYGRSRWRDGVRRNNRRDDVLADWRLLADASKSQYRNVVELAPRIGMSPAALEKALCRAKRDGVLVWPR